MSLLFDCNSILTGLFPTVPSNVLIKEVGVFLQLKVAIAHSSSNIRIVLKYFSDGTNILLCSKYFYLPFALTNNFIHFISMHEYLPFSRQGAIDLRLPTGMGLEIPICAVHIKLLVKRWPCFIYYLKSCKNDQQQQRTLASPSRGNQHRAHKLGIGKMVAIGTPKRVHLLPL
jgi:hypothetical protein